MVGGEIVLTKMNNKPYHNWRELVDIHRRRIYVENAISLHLQKFWKDSVVATFDGNAVAMHLQKFWIISMESNVSMPVDFVALAEVLYCFG